MSRIGKLPIKLPSGVSVVVDKDNCVTVKGPKGELALKINKRIKVTVEDGQVVVARELERDKALHGLYRSLLNNMVIGVSEGFKRELEIVGVGYKAQKKGNDLVLDLGFSHQVVFKAPKGISIDVPKPVNIVVSGIDKQLVGQVAANIRRIRPPEPYKGKGIRYQGEAVRKKAGKAAGRK